MHTSTTYNDRSRRAAHALLLLSASLFGLSFIDSGSVWPWIRAFAEAALIGGLADWFAVTALFQHPFGVPIPHTAIIPRQKGRLADGLAGFIGQQFLSADHWQARIQAAHPSKRLAQALCQPRHAQALAKTLFGIYRWLLTPAHTQTTHSRARPWIHTAVQSVLQRQDYAHLLRRLLQWLDARGLDQSGLTLGLAQIKKALAQEGLRETLAEQLLKTVSDEYPKLIMGLGFLGLDPKNLAQQLATAALSVGEQWAQSVMDDPNHPQREKFGDALKAWRERLDTDEALRTSINTWVAGNADRQPLADVAAALTHAIDLALQQGVSSSEQPSVGIQRAIRRWARRLARDHATQNAIDPWIAQYGPPLIQRFRSSAQDHIASTVRHWTDAQVIDAVETRVGRDLQYIRINGTLVGGGMGLLLHAIKTVGPF